VRRRERGKAERDEVQCLTAEVQYRWPGNRVDPRTVCHLEIRDRVPEIEHVGREALRLRREIHRRVLLRELQKPRALTPEVQRVGGEKSDRGSDERSDVQGTRAPTSPIRDVVLGLEALEIADDLIVVNNNAERGTSEAR
jgi:hypothetical protein